VEKLPLKAALVEIKPFYLIPNMGNCFKSSSQDDISLLHEDENPDSPGAGEPPPPYQVNSFFFLC